MGKTELRIAVDAELLRDAQDAGLDFEGLTEAAMRAALRNTPKAIAEAEERARQWAAENAEAIAAHKERIAKYGVFGEDLRTW